MQRCFSEGDLLYGPREARMQAVKFLTENKVINSKSIVFIDSYNDSIHDKVVLNSHLKGGDMREVLPLMYAFHILALAIEHREKDEYFGSYKYVVDRDSASSIYNPSEYIKKRCKLGVLFTLLRGSKIHFLLDGINFKSCIEKSQQIKPGVGWVGYTNSELRFIFRFWSRLESFYKKGMIKFWRERNGEYVEVNPPWLENPEQFSIYKPKHPDKYDDIFEKICTLEGKKLNEEDILKFAGELEKELTPKKSEIKPFVAIPKLVELKQQGFFKDKPPIIKEEVQLNGIEKIKKLIENDRRITLEEKSENLLFICKGSTDAEKLLTEAVKPLIDSFKTKKIINENFSLQEYVTLLESSSSTGWAPPTVRVEVPIKFIEPQRCFLATARRPN